MKRLFTLAGSVLLVAGCTGFSADGGFGRVRELTRERTGVAPDWQRSPGEGTAVAARVTELLGQPLSPESAVELALINNRGLQAAFHNLGIAEADVVRAGRMRNPSFGFSRRSGGGIVEIERSLVFDLAGLLTLPLALRMEEHRFEHARLQAAYDAIGVAGAARRAYFRAVASQELVAYFTQVKEAADASSELAGRMAAVGNFSRLARMREQAFYADATADLARARHQATSERERLARLLSLSGEQLDFDLPGRLPELPQQPAKLQDAEQVAMEKRLDIMLGRQSTEAVATSLGLSRATRMVNVLHLGYANASETGEVSRSGYEIEVELPLFDFGSARVARAESVYMQAVQRMAAIAINARSEVRESYSAYRTAHDLARHYRDEVVPLRRRISEENLLRYNGMLIGVFELLADTREQVAGVAGYVEALRDYWLADTDLQVALTGRSPGGSAFGPPSTAAAGSGHVRH